MSIEEPNKICRGILLVKTSEGTVAEKVLVEVKPGSDSNHIKCRLRKFTLESKRAAPSEEVVRKSRAPKVLLSEKSEFSEIFSEKNLVNAENRNDEEPASYIDSQLRRVNSEESRLYLVPRKYKVQKGKKLGSEIDVKPILREIDSDEVLKINPPAKKKQITEIVSMDDSSDSGADDTSEDEANQSVDDENKTLEELKKFEDTSYIIDVKGFGDNSDTSQVKFYSGKKQRIPRDFCIHSFEIGDFFSDTSDTSQVKFHPGKKQQEIPRDFCVHSLEVGDSKTEITVEE